MRYFSMSSCNCIQCIEIDKLVKQVKHRQVLQTRQASSLMVIMVFVIDGLLQQLWFAQVVSCGLYAATLIQVLSVSA